MTNKEAQKLIESVLLISITEADAAVILAGIEIQLKDEASQQRLTAEDAAHRCPTCGYYCQLCAVS